MIPYNITREHIISAIEKIQKEGIPNGADSDYYDVLFENKKYPPKLLISWANIFANGKELDRSSFEGGINTNCFKILDKEGFEIINKQTGNSVFYESIISFLKQAQTLDLKTKSFLNQFRNLKIKVSFGAGGKANVPWVAILKDGQEVQEGIYPVYLYFIERQILILAYGVSETNQPKNQWHFKEKKDTLKEYFLKRFDTNPFRYGNSYVYKVYDINPAEAFFGLTPRQVIGDVNQIIDEYFNVLPEYSNDVKESETDYIPHFSNEHPLNTILYGPPGTGKTYNSINHALSIIKGYNLDELIKDQLANPENRIKHKREYDELVKAGQICFVTFHQSYGYEEFVEGIKPKVNSNGDIEYNIENGIFKNMCLVAGEKKLTQNFDSVYEQYITDLINSTNEYELKTPALSKPFIVKVNSKGNCVAIPRTETATEMTITKKMLRNYIEHGIVDDWKPYTTAIASDIKSKYSIQFETVNNTNKNFVIIIDEINRGNISKIFGELITLIEDSKRVGEKEELKLKLTYSGSDNEILFGIPNNVFVIGTMNSADRSIALMDTALRRRFTFIEYSAFSKVLSENMDGINLKLLLETMNDRLRFLLDKDHILGHAYLIDVKTKNQLCSVFRDRIIPLLEEYFYGDYNKIQLVLGDNRAFGKQEQIKLIQTVMTFDQRKLFGTEIEGFEEKYVYRINEDLLSKNFDNIPHSAFTSIYKSQ